MDAVDHGDEPLGGSSGCCLLRLEAVRSLGGLELAYFAYLEDVDLGARLARAGYGARLVRDAVSWHQGSASAGPTSPLKTSSSRETANPVPARGAEHPRRAPRAAARRAGSRPRLLHVLLCHRALARPTRRRPPPALHGVCHRARTTHDDRSTRPRLTRRATLLDARRKRTVADAAVAHGDSLPQRVPTNGWAVSDRRSD